MINKLEFKHIKGKTKRGLKYIIFRDDNTLSLSIYIITKAGAIFAKKPGTAHFLEHVFIGLSTKKETLKKRTKQLEIHGIHRNASTGYETITYSLVAPYTELNYAFKVLNDEFIQAKFDPKEVEKERKVIKDEIIKGENNIFKNLTYLELQNYFPKNSPYSHRIAGTVEELNNITIEDLKEHYKLLNNKNMALGISGNINEKQAIKLIEEFSESLHQSKGEGNKLIIKKPQYKKPQRFYNKPSKLSQNAVFTLSKIYKKSKLKKSKKEILYKGAIEDIIINLFARAESSYLWKALRTNSGLVYGYWFDIWNQRYFNLTSLTLDVPKENVKKALKIVNKEINKLLNRKIKKSEINYWKKYTQNRFMLITTEHNKILPTLVRPYFFESHTYTPMEMLRAQEKINQKDINDYLKKTKDNLRKDPIVAIFTGNSRGIVKKDVIKYLNID